MRSGIRSDACGTHHHGRQPLHTIHEPVSTHTAVHRPGICSSLRSPDGPPSLWKAGGVWPIVPSAGVAEHAETSCVSAHDAAAPLLNSEARRVRNVLQQALEVRGSRFEVEIVRCPVRVVVTNATTLGAAC